MITLALSHIITLLVTGVIVGFASGLLGLGGAFIMTPVQYWVYTNMGLSTDMAIKLAFGTNLLAVLTTVISGVWQHHRRGAVWWRAAIIMGCCSLASALGGATIAVHLPGAALKMGFGALVLAAAIRMVTAQLPKIEETPRSNPWLWVGVALPLGLVTGLVGIGGGILVVPIMTLLLRFQMHRAVATSLAMMLFTSTGGVIGYIVNGLGISGLPAHSIGYVNLQSWFLLSITSVGLAQVGAMTAHRLPAKQLRYIFIVLMFYIGLKMLGLFDWLGWPI